MAIGTKIINKNFVIPNFFFKKKTNGNMGGVHTRY